MAETSTDAKKMKKKSIELKQSFVPVAKQKLNEKKIEKIFKIASQKCLIISKQNQTILQATKN